MRIYLPLLAQDRPALREGRALIDLEPGRAAWAVTSEASADRPGQYEEDLEYEALQEAVHVAFTAAERSERVLVIAAAAPDDVIDAVTAEADDTDPALLWFDAGEGQDALVFLETRTSS